MARLLSGLVRLIADARGAFRAAPFEATLALLAAATFSVGIARETWPDTSSRLLVTFSLAIPATFARPRADPAPADLAPRSGPTPAPAPRSALIPVGWAEAPYGGVTTCNGDPTRDPNNKCKCLPGLVRSDAVKPYACECEVSGQRQYYPASDVEPR